MGLFDDHIGVWCGTHVVIDGQGCEVDRFEATVQCRRKGNRWFQTTARAWPDGRVAEREFFRTFDAEGVPRYEHPHVVGHGRNLGGHDIVSVWMDPDHPDVSHAHQRPDPALRAAPSERATWSRWRAPMASWSTSARGAPAFAHPTTPT